MTDDDLVKQLRYVGDHGSYEPEMHHTAADRIEALLYDYEDLARRYEHALQKIDRLEETIDDLNRERVYDR